MRLTLVLILLMVVVFAYELFLADTETFFNTYGFSGANLLERPYVLITSIFIHGSAVHLLSNIMVMLFFSSPVESELGKTKALLIFLVGAIAGDIFSLFVYPFDAISVGASAGIFALIGAGILVKPFDLSLYPFILPVPLALVGMLYAIYNLYGLFFDAGSNISYAAHFGGLIIGLYAGFRLQGFRKSAKIIIVSLFVLLAIPIIIFLLRNVIAKWA